MFKNKTKIFLVITSFNCYLKEAMVEIQTLFRIRSPQKEDPERTWSLYYCRFHCLSGSNSYGVKAISRTCVMASPLQNRQRSYVKGWWKLGFICLCINRIESVSKHFRGKWYWTYEAIKNTSIHGERKLDESPMLRYP